MKQNNYYDKSKVLGYYFNPDVENSALHLRACRWLCQNFLFS